MNRFCIRGIFLGAAVAISSIAGAATATTITFDEVPDEGNALYDENFASYYEEGDVRVTSGFGAVAYEGIEGAVHLDNSGTGLASDLTVRAGSTFSANSFSIISQGYLFLGERPRKLGQNLFVTGFIGDTVVAMMGFTVPEVAGMRRTFSLGDEFAGLTSLVISLVADYRGCDSPCVHMDLDELDLTMDPAPVPLPASAPLLAMGGLALAALSRRRKRG